jgi:hypothetical protein
MKKTLKLTRGGNLQKKSPPRVRPNYRIAIISKRKLVAAADIIPGAYKRIRHEFSKTHGGYLSQGGYFPQIAATFQNAFLKM